MIKTLAIAAATYGFIATAAFAADSKFYDDGNLALVAAVRAGIAEASVPVFHNGALVGLNNVIEAYDRVPGTASYPLTAAHLVANTFERLTYQKADGSTGALGTSVIGTASYRTPSGLQLVPTVSRADVTTGISGRYSVAVQADFGSSAHVTSAVSFPDPPIGQSTARLDVTFNPTSDITLASAQPFPGNDRFRVMTVSSMFASPTQYDANLIRYQDSSGAVRTFSLTGATPRDAHLFAAPVAISSWFELVKTPGSTWYPDSPSTRVSVLDGGSLRLGLQGFLAGSANPNDDSLSLWLEWLDAPNLVASGTSFGTSFQIAAAPVPEPGAWLMLLAGLPLLVRTGGVRRARRDALCK